MRTHTRTCTHAHAHTYTHTNAHAQAYMHAHTHSHTHITDVTHAHAHACMHALTCTHTHRSQVWCHWYWLLHIKCQYSLHIFVSFKHQLLTNRGRNWAKNFCEKDTIESISSLNLQRHFAVRVGTWLARNHVYYAKPTFYLLCFCAMMTKYELWCNIAWIKHVWKTTAAVCMLLISFLSWDASLVQLSLKPQRTYRSQR